MGLAKPGRLRVDQPTITGELGPAPDAYTHYSPVMIAALSKTAGRSAFDQGGPFFLRQAGGRGGKRQSSAALCPPWCAGKCSRPDGCGRGEGDQVIAGFFRCCRAETSERARLALALLWNRRLLRAHNIRLELA